MVPQSSEKVTFIEEDIGPASCIFNCPRAQKEDCANTQINGHIYRIQQQKIWDIFAQLKLFAVKKSFHFISETIDDDSRP